MTPEIDLLRAYAKGLDQDVRNLEARYGKGTRPAWVGEEISIISHRAEKARAEADALAALQPA